MSGLHCICEATALECALVATTPRWDDLPPAPATRMQPVPNTLYEDDGEPGSDSHISPLCLLFPPHISQPASSFTSLQQESRMGVKVGNTSHTAECPGPHAGSRGPRGHLVQFHLVIWSLLWRAETSSRASLTSSTQSYIMKFWVVLWGPTEWTQL